MVNLNFNFIKNLFLTAFVSINLVANDTSNNFRSELPKISEERVAKELHNIINIQARNSNLRRAAYTVAVSAIVYYIGSQLKSKYSPAAQPAKEMTEISKSLLEQEYTESFFKEFNNFLETKSANIDKNNVKEQAAKGFKIRLSNYHNLLSKFLMKLNTEQFTSLIINLEKLSPDAPKPAGFTKKVGNFFWGIADFLNLPQMAFFGALYWGKDKIAHFVQELDYDFYLEHYTNFEKIKNLFNSSTIINSQKANNPEYIELSKKNSKLIYVSFVKEAEKVLAFMKYIESKLDTQATSENKTAFKSKMNILIQNLKENVNSIAELIETYDLPGIKNRLASIESITVLFRI